MTGSSQTSSSSSPCNASFYLCQQRLQWVLLFLFQLEIQIFFIFLCFFVDSHCRSWGFWKGFRTLRVCESEERAERLKWRVVKSTSNWGFGKRTRSRVFEQPGINLWIKTKKTEIGARFKWRLYSHKFRFTLFSIAHVLEKDRDITWVASMRMAPLLKKEKEYTRKEEGKKSIEAPKSFWLLLALGMGLFYFESHWKCWSLNVRPVIGDETVEASYTTIMWRIYWRIVGFRCIFCWKTVGRFSSSSTTWQSDESVVK